MSLTPSLITSLRLEVDLIKEAFLEGVRGGPLTDLAFIGNSSDLYAWEPALITDLDVCLFVSRRDTKAGTWLLKLRDRFVRDLDKKGLDFELRIIRGPYKHAALAPTRPAVVAHVSLFTEDLYVHRPVLLRWAWRKYRCTVDQEKFRRLAPPKPTIHELLQGRSGVEQKLGSIESGTAPMVELSLPDLAETVWTIQAGQPLFAEYCLDAGLVCARNHARVLNHPEPDCLGNRDFGRWYEQHLLKSSALQEIIDLKGTVRTQGYAAAVTEAQTLARAYLHELHKELTAHRGF